MRPSRPPTTKTTRARIDSVKDLMGMMKQAKAMQEKMQDLQQ